MKMNTLIVTTMTAIVCSIGTPSFADQDKQKSERRGPPAEAFEACSGMQSGASVSFVSPRGDSLSATCQEIRGQLVAVPEGHRKRRQKPGADGA